MTCETANFRVDDVDCLVRASLACPTCLSGEVDWFLCDDRWDPCVECACRACGGRHIVYLTPGQALRLTLHLERPLAALGGRELH